MGPSVQTGIVLRQGVDLLLQYFFFNPPASGSTAPQDLVPVDFTGCTARLMVRRGPDAADDMLLSLTSGAGLTLVSGTITPGPPVPSSPNGIQIVVARAQSLAMNGGVALDNAYYDLLIDWPNSTTTLLMCGPFKLATTVTR